MIFWLLLMVLPVGSEGPDVVGQWNLVDVQWLDPDRLEPPREIKLSLLGDGTARLETAVVSRSYRMTTDGCKVNETRRDPLSLRGAIGWRGRSSSLTGLVGKVRRSSCQSTFQMPEAGPCRSIRS